MRRVRHSRALRPREGVRHSQALRPGEGFKQIEILWTERFDSKFIPKLSK